MKILDKIKSYFKKSSSTEGNIITLESLVDIPRRRDLNCDELIDKEKEEFKNIIKNKDVIFIVDEYLKENVDNINMYIDILLNLLTNEEKEYLLEEINEDKSEALDNYINLLKYQIYQIEIEKVKTNTKAKLVALNELLNGYTKRYGKLNRVLNPKKLHELGTDINYIKEIMNHLMSSVIVMESQSKGINIEVNLKKEEIKSNKEDIECESIKARLERVSKLGKVFLNKEVEEILNSKNDELIRISLIESLLEKYCYKNSNMLEEYQSKVKEDIDLYTLLDIEVIYKLFDGYSRKQIDEEEVKRLYEIMFNLHVKEYKDNHTMGFITPEINHSEYAVYTSNVLKRLEDLRNDPENKEIIKDIETILKNGNGQYVAIDILQDEMALNFIIHFHDKEYMSYEILPGMLKDEYYKEYANSFGGILKWNEDYVSMDALASMAKKEVYRINAFSALHNIYIKLSKNKKEFMLPYGLLEINKIGEDYIFRETYVKRFKEHINSLGKEKILVLPPGLKTFDGDIFSEAEIKGLIINNDIEEIKGLTHNIKIDELYIPSSLRYLSMNVFEMSDDAKIILEDVTSSRLLKKEIDCLFPQLFTLSRNNRFSNNKMVEPFIDIFTDGWQYCDRDPFENYKLEINHDFRVKKDSNYIKKGYIEFFVDHIEKEIIINPSSDNPITVKRDYLEGNYWAALIKYMLINSIFNQISVTQTQDTKGLIYNVDDRHAELYSYIDPFSQSANLVQELADFSDNEIIEILNVFDNLDIGKDWLYDAIVRNKNITDGKMAVEIAKIISQYSDKVELGYIVYMLIKQEYELSDEVKCIIDNHWSTSTDIIMEAIAKFEKIIDSQNKESKRKI